jgi:hypothetical protein
LNVDDDLEPTVAVLTKSSSSETVVFWDPLKGTRHQYGCFRQCSEACLKHACRLDEQLLFSTLDCMYNHEVRVWSARRAWML